MKTAREVIEETQIKASKAVMLWDDAMIMAMKEYTVQFLIECKKLIYNATSNNWNTEEVEIAMQKIKEQLK